MGIAAGYYYYRLHQDEKKIPNERDATDANGNIIKRRDSKGSKYKTGDDEESQGKRRSKSKRSAGKHSDSGVDRKKRSDIELVK
jgi:hypothetical protein